MTARELSWDRSADAEALSGTFFPKAVRRSRAQRRTTAPPPPKETAELVELASAGNGNAFELLWKRYAPAVHAILLSLVPDQDLDDLMQDVAVCALDSIHTLRNPRSFPGWVCAIARNAGRNALNRSRRRPQLLGENDDLRTSPPSSAEAEADEILEHIRYLPKCYREPLVLRLVLQMSGPEIAEHTGMTSGSVRVNLHRGMQMLRRRLERAL